MAAVSGRVLAALRGMSLRNLRYLFVAVAAAGLLASAPVEGQQAQPAQQKEQKEKDPPKLSKDARLALIRRAQVWSPTNVASMDLRAGPQGPGAFAPGQTVSCTYVDRKLSGATPKFACDLGNGDEVKVKFGAENGEVEGEVAATRLLWALGFGADRMYPVRVICRGCPAKLEGEPGEGGAFVFDPAAIERKMAGHELESSDRQGWSWDELELIEPQSGGAPIAHRDALKLLAVMIQHTDTKSEQQRLVCLDDQKIGSGETCSRPFMMTSDLGLTFGRASAFNTNRKSSPNYERWSRTPIWKGDTGCEAVLNPSMTGTLGNPIIREAGRAFLADLLLQLSDKQLQDLFEVSRFDVRPRKPGDATSTPASFTEWVTIFKMKRTQIVSRTCS
jgi:hypothetical protein